VGGFERLVRVVVVAALFGTAYVAGSAVAGTTTAASQTVRDSRAPVASTIVLPRNYDTARWPVVYWLNVDYDGCVAQDCGPILRELADEPYISVLPLPVAGLADYVNWRDGSHHNETAYVDLVRYVDAHYRTVADRAHRVVTGISAGGYGAALLAGDHPDLFGGLAAFSGILDITDKGVAGQSVFIPTSQAPPPNIPTATGVYGAPLVHDVGWHAANPRDLLPNLRATVVFDSAANGVPCRREVRAPGSPVEVIVRDTSDNFDRQANALGVAHRGVRFGCGMHDYVTTFQREIRAWLARPLAARGVPTTFDYRATRPTFSVYGWTLTADSRRAEEWLTMRGAGRRGLTLVGSGLTTVRTPPLFAPRSRLTVTVDGTRRTAVTDAAGCATFAVSLGAPHHFEQYQPEQRAAAARGGYWQTAHITFG
jgi:hypothetical protein